MKKEKVCAHCGEPLEEDESEQLEDGTLLCSYCYDELYAECEMCGKVVLRDDMLPWGDCSICPECMEEQCPSFDEKENEKETANAYEAMKERYIGRKVVNYKNQTLQMTYELDDPCVTYSLYVVFDEEGIITELSKLSAEMLLSEWVNGSNWRPYAIRNDDYDWIVDDMFEEYVEFEDD